MTDGRPGVCGGTEDDAAALVGAAAEGAALQIESAPLGRADAAAPDAPRRVRGLTKNDIVATKKENKCRTVSKVSFGHLQNIYDKIDRDTLQ